MRVFVLALNIALGIVVIAWLHAPPWDYRQFPGDKPDAVGSQNKTSDQKDRTPASAPRLPLTDTKQGYDKAKATQSKRQNDPPEGWGVNDKIAAIAGLIALLQFIALLATWWLMARTARQQLRAYVTFFGGEILIVNLREGGVGLRIHVELRNSGQTPAYDFTTWVSQPVIDAPDASPFGPPRPINQRTGASIVAPGGSAHINWTMAVDTAVIADLRAGTKKLYIWGGCDYTDVFGRRRYFRFRDTSGDEVFQPFQGWSIAPHKLGYTASEQRKG